MGTMITRMRVRDYASWRQGFDAGQSKREASGLSNALVFRSAEDGNEVMLVFDVADMRKAKEFAASPYRKEAMQKAGVLDTPTDYFIE